jgi:hypothetical protein
MPHDAEANLRGPGNSQQVQLAASDSQWDILWLANHVSTATLTRLEKTDGALQTMYAQWLRDAKDFSEASLGNTSPGDVFVHDGENVLVTTVTANAADLAGRVKAMGFDVDAYYDGNSFGRVEVYTPVSRIPELAGVAGVSTLMAQPKPQTDAGSVQSEWVGVANVPQLNVDLPGITGNNIDYGVISDSFNQTGGGGGLAGGQASGDLPPGARVNILADAPGKDEGRAMSELIYDVAPSSDILFYAAGGPGGMASGINALQAAGADVIVDDITIFNESPFQDDTIAQAIDGVVTNSKVPYFSSAGNRNGISYFGSFAEGTFNDSYHAWDGDRGRGSQLHHGAGRHRYWGPALGRKDPGRRQGLRPVHL